MWLFSRKERQTLDDDIGDAVRLAAEEWIKFCDEGIALKNLPLRTKLSQFVPVFKPKMRKRFKNLRAAPPELMLLIMAEGVALSGELPRDLIECKLGIRLPEQPIV